MVVTNCLFEIQKESCFLISLWLCTQWHFPTWHALPRTLRKLPTSWDSFSLTSSRKPSILALPKSQLKAFLNRPLQKTPRAPFWPIAYLLAHWAQTPLEIETISNSPLSPQPLALDLFGTEKAHSRSFLSKSYRWLTTGPRWPRLWSPVWPQGLHWNTAGHSQPPQQAENRCMSSSSSTEGSGRKQDGQMDWLSIVLEASVKRLTFSDGCAQKMKHIK